MESIMQRLEAKKPTMELVEAFSPRLSEFDLSLLPQKYPPPDNKPAPLSAPEDAKTSHEALRLYQYRPLEARPYPFRPGTRQETFRLLMIEPARDHSDPIHCKLVHWPVASHYQYQRNQYQRIQYQRIQYQTLSYAWGPTRDDGSHLTHHVVCEGGLIRITANLHEALLQVRLDYAFNKIDSSKLPLWCDAVCVNQADIEERSTQVRLMGAIFAGSSRLIMWLGTFAGQEESTAFRQLLDDYGSDEQRNTSSQSVTHHEHKSLLKDILAKPYFTRRWIIQEVVLTSETYRWIFLGDQAFPYRTLERALDRLQLRDTATFLKYWSWEYKIQPRDIALMPRRTHFRSLLRNLDVFSATGCSDDRDRVFAPS
ncbi:hypothetical protein LTR27_004296 [Elasticomyces elasticus]|nr:hypothetical protein LTR27_004296 [Elasticomyces elasticus]